MSRLTETKRAYDKIVSLLDQQIVKRKGAARELELFRQSLDVAFYLLGWSQFEYLVREEAIDRIEENAKAQTVNKHAWRYLKENVKTFPIRRRLELIFHENKSIINSLDKDYDLRNDAAHNNKMLPKNARDISTWLYTLERLVDDFEGIK